jgi:hypothetical protein
MAITSIDQAPTIYSPAFNPIVWSFISDEADQQDMKYVIDIYVNGATGYTHRIKQRPNPMGYCIVDVSAIVQPYISLSSFQNEFGSPSGYTKPWATVLDPYYAGPVGQQPRIYADIKVLAGEEYTVNGTPTIFDGNGATGAPAYPLVSWENSFGGGILDDRIRILPAALPTKFGIINQADLSTTYSLFIYKIPLASAGFLEPLTINPGDNIVTDNDYHTLTFINWQDFGSGYDQGIYGARFTFYNSSGSIIGQPTLYNTIGEGGGPQANRFYTTLSYDRNYTILSLKCGPASIGTAIPGATNWTNCVSYTVEPIIKTDSLTTTFFFGPPTNFVKSTDCQDLYPRIRLSWLNELGGRDYFNFTKFYEKTTNTQSQYWSQSVLDYSGKYPYGNPYTGAPSNWAGTWLRGGEQSVNRTTTTSYRIQSDWVTQEQMDFLGTIAESSQVWAYLNQKQDLNTSSLEDTPGPVTVKITNLSYSYKLIKQVKLAQVSFDMTYTKIDQKQNIS